MKNNDVTLRLCHCPVLSDLRRRPLVPEKVDEHVNSFPNFLRTFPSCKDRTGKPACQDELPAKKPRKDEAATGENLPRYHWVYSIEPHDPAIDTWQKLPEELREAVELLLLDSPPKELWLPSSLVIGKYHAEVEKNLHKKWKVMENNLHTSDRTAVLSLQDGKIRKKGIHMFVHFRWRLKEDTALWMARMGFGLWVLWLT